LPEQGVPTSKRALTVWPSSTFDEGLNSAGALLFSTLKWNLKNISKY